jgi:SSS family solute:Na+ symporter
MSTKSTQLNWGSSYVVNDFYVRFIKPEASEKRQVLVGRISTVVLMILSALIALALSNALQAFNILLQIGAGTGLLFILRWFWWRINAFSELAAMIISFMVAVYFEFFGPEDLDDYMKLLIGVGITTVGWLVVTFLTPPTDHKTLVDFYNLIRPHNAGWQAVINNSKKSEIEAKNTSSSLGLEIACMIAGCFAVYGLLFATGFWIYGNTLGGVVATGLTILAMMFLRSSWKAVNS